MKKKKSVKKKSQKTPKHHKKKPSHVKPVKHTNLPKGTIKSIQIQTHPVLTQNFIALQKVMLTLSEKIDKLTNQTSRLLDLFEVSAKALAKENYKPMPPIPLKIPLAPKQFPIPAKQFASPGKPIPTIPMFNPRQQQGYKKSVSKSKPSK